jgi:hypothetical protein
MIRLFLFAAVLIGLMCAGIVYSLDGRGKSETVEYGKEAEATIETGTAPRALSPNRPNSINIRWQDPNGDWLYAQVELSPTFGSKIAGTCTDEWHQDYPCLTITKLKIRYLDRREMSFFLRRYAEYDFGVVAVADRDSFGRGCRNPAATKCGAVAYTKYGPFR